MAGSATHSTAPPATMATVLPVAMATLPATNSSAGTRWLRVDLQNPTQVGRFVLKHAGAGGENTAFNTRDFDIQTSVDGQTWSIVFAVRGNTADVRTHPITPVNARYVRVNVLVPTQNADQAARVYELEVY